MLAQMPDTIQDAWGEAVTRDFAVWLELIMTERMVGQDAWQLSQTRFDHLEARVETIEHDLAEVKADVKDLRRDLHDRFDRVVAMFNERFDRQAAALDERFDRQAAALDERFNRQSSEINVRFNSVDARFGEVNARFDRLQAQMISQTRWTVGTLALLGTLIAILVGIGQLRP